jgi:hypothetical protein
MIGEMAVGKVVEERGVIEAEAGGGLRLKLEKRSCKMEDGRKLQLLKREGFIAS